jgi:nitrate reductase assembly molybdenum cofactor insertion protein NarJ
MPPQTRKYARLLNDLESVVRRGKNMVEVMSRLELDSRALAHAKEIPDHLPLRNSGKDITVTDSEERE